MFLGYNTNGFAHHRLEDAIEILAELGYGGVALTPDVNHLHRWASGPNHIERAAKFGELLQSHGLRAVVETGARYVLDIRNKHKPTLISPLEGERELRYDWLLYCIDIAVEIDAGCLSFWSGSASDDSSPRVLMDRLVEQCKSLAGYAATRNVRLAFEPEPGMFIDTMDKFGELHAKVNHPAFGLTIDIGHLVCNGELPVSKFLADWKHVLWNVHIEDMRRGVHDHIMFGEGEVDFTDVFTGLRAANYEGGVYVELSRHSHDAVNTARRAKEFLERFVTS
jgi:L-ribulose-5-phosphate 3-epimerase